MADVDFFWDPVCPWAWITSRWVEEVAGQRTLDVDWRFIALRIVNEEKDYEKDFSAGLRRPATAAGPAPAAGRRRGAGRARPRAARPASTPRFGTRIHVEAAGTSLDPVSGIAAVPRGPRPARAPWPRRPTTTGTTGRPGRHRARPSPRRQGRRHARSSPSPPPDGPSSSARSSTASPGARRRSPCGTPVETVARFPGFAELKRTVRGKPQTS